MLSFLHIENIAVMETADLLFETGLNALTGETGAGKSIVVDAIGAVTGGRASRNLIRTGAKWAFVSGVFSEVQNLPWCTENGIEPDENGQLILQRQILTDGKNLCRVNGRPVTVAQLRALGGQLLNIHGQHDGQQLLDENCHRAYLDRFGGIEPALQTYQGLYRKLLHLERRLQAGQMDESEKARRLDSLQYQITELEQADLRIGEEDELQARREILRSAAHLTQAVETVHFAVAGDDDNDNLGAAALLMEAEQALESVAGVSPDLDDLRKRLTECRCLAQDVADTARNLQGSFQFEPEELNQLESRLDFLYRLKRKYGPTEQTMLQYLDQCRREQEKIQFADETMARLERELNTVLSEAKQAALRLSEARKTTAKLLQTKIQAELSQLDMKQVQFQVCLEPVQNIWGLDANGRETVRFLMSANAGEAVKPIQKIASGGELSRIMLALKNVLAEDDDIATLVFDEVDTGVSGRAAQRVAEKLAQVSRKKQVLCVTHLPQIAAMADTHFCVEKTEREGRTYTDVRVLDHAQRQAELVRLTAGDHVTQTALDSAEELLQAAVSYKKSRMQTSTENRRET